MTAAYEAALARGQKDAIHDWVENGGIDAPYNPRETSTAYVEGYDMALDYQQHMWAENEWGKELFKS